jgi:archaellum component FlaC
VYSEREIDQLKDDNRRLRKEVELAKTDLDQTMKMMENYENKIQLFQKKEENVVRVSKDLRDRMEQINLDRDKLALRESHFE